MYNEIYGKDKKGVELKIKRACYRDIDRFIGSIRNRPDRQGQAEYIDFANCKALPMDLVNCFEKERNDYSKTDAFREAMRLTDKEKEMLEYFMSGRKRSEIARMLSVTKSCMDYRKFRISCKYHFALYRGEYFRRDRVERYTENGEKNRSRREGYP